MLIGIISFSVETGKHSKETLIRKGGDSRKEGAQSNYYGNTISTRFYTNFEYKVSSI